jgi:hypothetical protein
MCIHVTTVLRLYAMGADSYVALTKLLPNFEVDGVVDVKKPDEGSGA